MNGLGRQKEEKKNKSQVFTKETLGIVFILFSALCLVCLITSDSVFSVPGKIVNAFLLGVFGYASFIVTLFGIIGGIILMVGPSKKIPLKKKVLFTLFLLAVVLLVHSVTARDFSSLSYGEYLATCYNNGDLGLSGATGGGIITGLICYFISSLFTNVGAYVILSVLTVLSLFFFVRSVKNERDKESRGAFTVDPQPTLNEVQGEKEYPVDIQEEHEQIGASPPTKKGQSLFIVNSSDFSFKTKKDLKRSENSQGIKLDDVDGITVANADQTYSKTFDAEMQRKINYVKTPPAIDLNSTLKDYENNGQETTVSEPIPIKKEEESIPMFEHEEKRLDQASENREKRFNDYINAEEFDKKETENQEIINKKEDVPDDYDNLPEKDFGKEIPFIEEDVKEEENKEEFGEQDFTENGEAESSEEYKDDFGESEVTEETYDVPDSNVYGNDRVREIFNIENPSEREEKDEVEPDPLFSSSDFGKTNDSEKSFEEEKGYFGGEEELEDEGFEEPVEEEIEEKPKEIPPINREYFRPPLDLLSSYDSKVDSTAEDHENKMNIIMQTLKEFKICVEPSDYIQGPTITRYQAIMPPGIHVGNVLSCDKNLQMRLASVHPVRIQAPIPGKDLIGIEVANKHPVIVGLKDVMEDMEKETFNPQSLMFALGKDLVGKAVYDNLSKGPHYLVAGATGMGKSVCLNTMIVSLIMRYSPEDLRLILIDPKILEFQKYEHLPHLMIDEIISDPRRVLAVLSWAYEEMQRRYVTLSQYGSIVSNVEMYNEKIANDTIPKIPRIVIVIDELADLMETCKKDLESRIKLLAGKSRAAGIHLVLATQRPSTDVITGTIKTNLPSRIAFRVPSFTDSQVMISEAGAEKLLGNGDMLYKNSQMPGFERYQGALITAEEVTRVVSYIKENNKAYFDDDLLGYLKKETEPEEEEDDDDPSGESVEESNPLFLKSLALGVTCGSIAISQLRRRFGLGHSTAGKIIDTMERLGYVSGFEGSKPRKVFITKEQYEQKYGPLPSPKDLW